MLAVVDGRYAPLFQAPLARLGFETVPGASCDCLEAPAAGHPDMTLFPAGAQEAIAAPEAAAYYRAVLGEKGMKIVQGSANLFRKYPTCAAYNVANTGRYAFCRADVAAPEILQWCAEHEIKVISVRQGYAKCSVCVVSESAIVTADASIARAAEGARLDVLRIRPGFVSLPGYPYGFLGGASGLLRPGLLVFAGDLKSHPDGAEIEAFCRMRGVRTESLFPGALRDVGSILTFAL